MIKGHNPDLDWTKVLIQVNTDLNSFKKPF